ncbi:nuclear transport factor 2 family protein [Paractinoplanes lichenicola]|uniref:Nuclear transport factor 2 family protein n=1 Tax=Paractinoplanes lichenicola TaxID=2802976 RepID=A0ABS1VKW2_9ACTN|nr:nuclear transport factor 2 family protein [Actinoplanes lichenicola]MBL7255362.1 nuclear transport factor 2 family protein [Actinoplanes lichenicola]
MTGGGPAQAVHDLSEAFAARDLNAALACFTPGDDIAYAGSELTETATGRAALTTLLGDVFLRPESYAWKAGDIVIHRFGDHAYVFAEASGVARPDEGTEENFPYRVSGLVEQVGGRWLWRHCQGGEPST